MNFVRPGGGVLALAPSAILTLESFRQVGRDDPESGGVLLGRLLRGSDDVVVDEASPPVASDRRTRTSFQRSLGPAQRTVNDAWEASSGTSNYLGEWHTHPESDPTPSGCDRRDWERIVKKAQFAQDTLFFVIVGQDTIRVWECDKATRLIVELEPVAAEDTPMDTEQANRLNPR